MPSKPRTVYLDDNDYERIRELCRPLGKKVSAWMREAILTQLRQQEGE